MFNKLLFNKLQYHVHEFNINPWLKFGGLQYSIQYTFLTITSLLHGSEDKGSSCKESQGSCSWLGLSASHSCIK